MNTSKSMQYLLDQSHLTIQEMSELLGVARNNFYLWKSGKSVPKQATVIKLSNILDIPLYDDNENSSDKNNYTKKSIGSFPISPEKTIDLLYKHIVLQNEKINQLKKKLNQTQNKIPQNDKSIDGNINYNYSVNFSYSIDFNALSAIVTYNKIDNYKMINEYLGYSESEINQMFAFGLGYEYQNHPIHKMTPMHEKKSMFNRMTDMINNIKTSMGQIDEWKISLPAIYLNRSGEELPAMNVYIIDFINNTGVCKIHFMKNEF